MDVSKPESSEAARLYGHIGQDLLNVSSFFGHQLAKLLQKEIQTSQITYETFLTAHNKLANIEGCFREHERFKILFRHPC